MKPFFDLTERQGLEDITAFGGKAVDGCGEYGPGYVGTQKQKAQSIQSLRISPLAVHSGRKTERQGVFGCVALAMEGAGMGGKGVNGDD